MRVLDPDNGLLELDVHVILMIEILDSEVVELVVSTDAEAIPAHPGVERLDLWCDNGATGLFKTAIFWSVILELSVRNALESVEPWSTTAMRLPFAVTVFASAVNIQSLLGLAFVAIRMDDVVMNSETIVHASQLAMFLGGLFVVGAEDVDIVTLLNSGSGVLDCASLATSKRSDPLVCEFSGLLVFDGLAASTSL